MSKLAVICTVLAVGGCGKKQDEPAKSDKPTTTQTETTKTSPAGAPAAPAAAAKLTCDKILPKDLRDKYFAGYSIIDNPQAADIFAECKLEKGEEATSHGTVNIGCHENIKAAKDASIKGIKDNMKDLKDMPGVGDNALSQEMMGMTQIMFWKDTCQASLMVPKGVDAVAFAKDLAATLPPK